jgi:hypothetical protein
MNDKNKITKNDEQPALHEVETTELQAIVGGHVITFGGPLGHPDVPPPPGYGPVPVLTHLQQ